MEQGQEYGDEGQVVKAVLAAADLAGEERQAGQEGGAHDSGGGDAECSRGSPTTGTEQAAKQQQEQAGNG